MALSSLHIQLLHNMHVLALSTPGLLVAFDDIEILSTQAIKFHLWDFSVSLLLHWQPGLPLGLGR